MLTPRRTLVMRQMAHDGKGVIHLTHRHYGCRHGLRSQSHARPEGEPFVRIGPARVMVDAGVRRLRRLAKRAVHARELRARRPPRLASGTDPRRAPVVYYLTPDDNSPRGGVRVNYRHVDLLNAGGIEAAVLHTRTGFRCDWFANETRVVGASDVTLHPDDALVVPQKYATGVGLLPSVTRKPVFTQGPYYTF